VKTALLDRFVFCCLVEDRGNAPRIQSPCKGNQLTLEHPPNWYSRLDWFAALTLRVTSLRSAICRRCAPRCEPTLNRV